MKKSNSEIAKFYGSTASTEKGLTAFLTKKGFQSIAQAGEAIERENAEENARKNANWQSFLSQKETKKALKSLPRFVHYNFLKLGRNNGTACLKMMARLKKLQGGETTGFSTSIRDLSYRTADWGRLQKTYQGENRFSCEGIRTTDNGKGGWDKVVWHHADYFFVENAAHDQFFWKLANGQSGSVQIKNGQFVFGKETYQRYDLINAHGLKITKDENGLAWKDLNGELFHFASSDWVSKTIAEKTLQTALAAFKKRRNEKNAAAFVAENLQKIYVTTEDSISAGNCSPMTVSFLKEMEAHLGASGPIGAVLAAVILEKRDDSYTRRAINYAAQRYQK